MVSVVGFNAQKISMPGFPKPMVYTLHALDSQVRYPYFSYLLIHGVITHLTFMSLFLVQPSLL